MDYWQAIVLGVVEGLTEYLPVSSTGHLILAQRAMGIGKSEAADAYAVCIQGGAIAAVLGIYFRRFRQMALGVVGRDPEGRRLAVRVCAAVAVTLAVAYVLKGPVKEHLFGLWPVVLSWFVGGVAILVVPRLVRPWAVGEQRELAQLTVAGALVIGLCQCVAVWPGTSRSLMTIAAGLAVGLRMSAAVEFSFLVGLPTLLAATANDAREHGDKILALYSLPVALAGGVAAAAAAFLAVTWMVRYLQSHGLAVFGVYRIGIAAVVAALLLLGYLDP